MSILAGLHGFKAGDYFAGFVGDQEAGLSRLGHVRNALQTLQYVNKQNLQIYNHTVYFDDGTVVAVGRNFNRYMAEVAIRRMSTREKEKNYEGKYIAFYKDDQSIKATQFVFDDGEIKTKSASGLVGTRFLNIVGHIPCVYKKAKIYVGSSEKTISILGLPFTISNTGVFIYTKHPYMYRNIRYGNFNFYAIDDNSGTFSLIYNYSQPPGVCYLPNQDDVTYKNCTYPLSWNHDDKYIYFAYRSDSKNIYYSVLSLKYEDGSLSFENVVESNFDLSTEGYSTKSLSINNDGNLYITAIADDGESYALFTANMVDGTLSNVVTYYESTEDNKLDIYWDYLLYQTISSKTGGFSTKSIYYQYIRNIGASDYCDGFKGDNVEYRYSAGVPDGLDGNTFVKTEYFDGITEGVGTINPDTGDYSGYKYLNKGTQLINTMPECVGGLSFTQDVSPIFSFYSTYYYQYVYWDPPADGIENSELKHKEYISSPAGTIEVYDDTQSSWTAPNKVTDSSVSDLKLSTFGYIYPLFNIITSTESIQAAIYAFNDGSAFSINEIYAFYNNSKFTDYFFESLGFSKENLLGIIFIPESLNKVFSIFV